MSGRSTGEGCDESPYCPHCRRIAAFERLRLSPPDRRRSQSRQPVDRRRQQRRRLRRDRAADGGRMPDQPPRPGTGPPDLRPVARHRADARPVDADADRISLRQGADGRGLDRRLDRRARRAGAPDLVRKAPDSWKNLHGTVIVPLKARLTLFNKAKGKSTLDGMRDTAARIQAIVRDAVAQKVRLRPVGSRWSFSEVAGGGGGGGGGGDQQRNTFFG